MDPNKPTKVYITTENEFEVKDRTSPKTINLERFNQWRIKDHTKPKDVKITLAGGTFDHNALDNRDMENQHPMSAITGLLEFVNSLATVAFTGKLEDLTSDTVTILNCGTSTEVI